jgi:hypothetical protein
MNSNKHLRKFIPFAALTIVIMTSIALFLSFRSIPFSKIKNMAPLIYPTGTKMASVKEDGTTVTATLEIPKSEIENFIKDNSLQESRVGSTLKSHSCVNKDFDIELEIDTQTGETVLTLKPRKAADSNICR